ncbi:hypothetical protein MASR2M18_00220 [Ignavibacteria bacterium]|nr:hypothetical protein [Bacteroidota bacterium]MCZ2131778.1 hypothetical protein [Bacteroidota bacterium]
MRIFLTPQTIALDGGQITKARQFARAVISTVDYRDSEQYNLPKIELDHFISKIGEEAVRAVFSIFGADVSAPDYAIYIGKKKSWEDDMTVNGIGLAVKTQSKSAAERYGLSWTFQSSGLRRDPILMRPEAWVCFVECDNKSSDFICRVFPPYRIRELIFKSPKLSHLIGKKRVVYAADLPLLSI